MTPEEKEALYREFRKRFLYDMETLLSEPEDLTGFWRVVSDYAVRPSYFFHTLSCEVCHRLGYADEFSAKCDEGLALWQSKE